MYVPLDCSPKILFALHHDTFSASQGSVFRWNVGFSSVLWALKVPRQRFQTRCEQVRSLYALTVGDYESPIPNARARVRHQAPHQLRDMDGALGRSLFSASTVADEPNQRSRSRSVRYLLLLGKTCRLKTTPWLFVVATVQDTFSPRSLAR